ncbi:hypothetical protein [Pelagicoccus sp. SDUM812002]|uniref:hypothetical protein n=1 Tax=Pelagicoccus sp. SDUM812002 TaxID=3041266 RepID=UPI00280F9E80|nr:hypothetical protein [Pelagicoccus sp. SDUM812002]MDQ8188264.1 hypothetical protein [Pelagicoccus sp. SDUM812002]
MKQLVRTAQTTTFRLISRIALTSIALAWGTTAQGSDFKETETAWEFKSGLDKAAFAKSFNEKIKEGFRIADIETYRSGRSTTVSTIWTKLANDEVWQVEMSLPITDFLQKHENHLENGYSLVEFEVDRFGATLHFSGVWMKGQEGLETEFHFGMESLAFSNRYGEMADRGFRLIDFEAYEANGKFRHAGVWKKNTGGHEVRFYRGIEKEKFGKVAAALDEGGFRLLDVEGYQFEGDFVFGAEWVKRAEWQKSQYAFDLLPDEFYNKNSMYLSDGYRLTEFETYENNGVVYYCGSWLKGNPADYVAEEAAASSKKKKKSSLEQFRSGN